MKSCCYLILIVLASFSANAQSGIPFLKEQVTILAGPAMFGRGYVDGGGDSAAAYISQQFKQYGLKSFPGEGGYYQSYHFPVNSFPGKAALRFNHKKTDTGKDFLVHGASNGIRIKNKKPEIIDLSGVKDPKGWQDIRKGFKPDGVYLLRNMDTVMKYSKIGIRSMAKSFDKKGVYLVLMKQKLTWLATIDTVSGTILFVEDSIMPKKVRVVSVDIESKFMPAFPTQNILGFVRGTEQPDSFVVFTAHYDHLGEMGKGNIFPGANDNASGTSVLLYLARYYAAHPGKYSMAFIAFSGEEAGLIGSGYYVTHPRFPLKQIRFLVNLDMAGDATKGITVVNAAAADKEFSIMKNLQNAHSYLPSIAPRAQTQNSDHYSFSEKGVPAVYIYTNGIKPYYHDLRDKPEEVNFEQVDGLLELLKNFVKQL